MASGAHLLDEVEPDWRPVDAVVDEVGVVVALFDGDDRLVERLDPVELESRPAREHEHRTDELVGVEVVVDHEHVDPRVDHRGLLASPHDSLGAFAAVRNGAHAVS